MSATGFLNREHARLMALAYRCSAAAAEYETQASELNPRLDPLTRKRVADSNRQQAADLRQRAAELEASVGINQPATQEAA